MKRLVLLSCALWFLFPLSLSAEGKYCTHFPLLFAERGFAHAAISISALHYQGEDEFVEITNRSTFPFSLEGYRLQSVEGDQCYVFGAVTLLPRGKVRLHSGPSAWETPPEDLLWTRRHIWRNAGDEAQLYDDRDLLVDRWAY